MMSIVPSSNEQNELVVWASEMGPQNPKDPPSRWQKFIDGLRQVVGLKPLYLLEWLSVAKVAQQEAEAFDKRAQAEEKLIKARAEYERAKAEVIKAEGEASKNEAEARLTDQWAEDHVEDRRFRELMRRMLAARAQSVDDAREQLEEIIRQIELSGGRVEMRLPEPPEEDVPDRT